MDADAAFRCGAHVATEAKAFNVTASLQNFAMKRASLVIGNRFGIFAVRHDTWALGWLDRVATALETRPLLCARWRWPENAAARTVGTGRDARRTVVAPPFAGKNFRHLAGGSHPRGDRYNATTARGAQVSQRPPQSGGKWARPRLNYYLTRFEEDTACLRKH